MRTVMRFCDFDFGLTQAEDEAKTNPKLLQEGFVDLNGECGSLLNSSKFLVLGGKGTGKSAIAQHLQLSRPCVSVVRLQHYHYNDILKIAGNRQSYIPRAWSWLMLLSLFCSFMKAKEPIGTAAGLESLYRALEASGLVGPDSTMNPSFIEELFLACRRDGFKSKIAAAYRAVLEPGTTISHQAQTLQGQADFDLSQFVRILESALVGTPTSYRHFLIIDDTDKIRDTNRNLDQSSLVSLLELIQEASHLNDLFAATNGAKIIVLCRTELIERLPGPKVTPIIQDYSLELNWYASCEEGVIPLIRVANQRASFQCGENVDVFLDYMPEMVGRRIDPLTATNKRVGHRYLPIEPVPSLGFLLDRTRYTPRDVVSLLRHIQKYSPETKASQRGISAGLGKYAQTYFVTEIRDELDGYLLASELESLMEVFGTIRDELFRIEDISKLLPARHRERLPEMLKDLFNCGAIGNWEGPGNPVLRTYRYRFPDCRLNLRGRMALHPALGIAINALPAEDRAKEEEFAALATGEVLRVSRPSQPGTIRSNDGWIFQFQHNDVQGGPRVRLCKGDLVGFEPPPLELINSRARGIPPFPPVRKVRGLLPELLR